MSGDVVGFHPLYRQVRDILVKRIADGVWLAGQILPSEPEIAADLGVSQGTVRKALDEMTAQHLVIRRQGRGTFVARHDDARILFQFFRIMPDSGERRFPECRVIPASSRQIPEAAETLGLLPDEPILAIERVCALDGEPCIIESIRVSARLFPDLHERQIPDNLYDFYASAYGVTVGRASEKVKAVAAARRDADLLRVPEGTPILQVDRLAFSLAGRCVEWRVSRCLTDRVHYASELR
jgi:GntR family transcriptional regulator